MKKRKTLMKTLKTKAGKIKRHVERWIEKREFKRSWGFPPEDIWSLDVSLLEWLEPRLDYLIYNYRQLCIPGCMYSMFHDAFGSMLNCNKTFDEIAQLRWMRILMEIRQGFQYHLINMSEKKEWRPLTEEESKAVGRASTLFGRYMYALWT